MRSTWIAIAEQGMAEGDYLSGAWEVLVESSGKSVWDNIQWDAVTMVNNPWGIKK
jgi:hypothetical protein